MTQEQLNKMAEYFAKRTKTDKVITRDYYLESIIMLTKKSFAEKVLEGKTFSYEDFKKEFLACQPDKKVIDFLRSKRFSCEELRGYDLKNDMAPERRGYLFQGVYMDLLKKNPEIDNIMKNDFLGGKEMSDKKQEYFAKQPLRVFAEYSTNVSDRIFGEFNADGRKVYTKDLNLITAKESFTSYKAMTDKVKSCGFFDIIFHLPSYFGLKKNIKNLRDSLIEKGMPEDIIDNVDNGKFSPKDATIDYLYKTDKRFKNEVDELEADKNEVEKNEVEKNEVEKNEVNNKNKSKETVYNEHKQELEASLKRELKPKEESKDMSLEKNQRMSAAQSITFTEKDRERMIAEGLKEKDPSTDKRTSQFTAANHIANKNKTFTDKTTSPKPLTDEDLKNDKTRNEFNKRMDKVGSKTRSVVSSKLKKAGEKPLPASGHERRELIKKVDRLNKDTDAYMAEYLGEKKIFDQKKAEFDASQKEYNEIKESLEDMEPAEQQQFLAEHPELKEKYVKAEKISQEFEKINSDHQQYLVEHQGIMMQKITARNQAMDEYNKKIGNEKSYEKSINELYTSENMKEILPEEFIENQVKTGIADENVISDQIIEKKLEARNIYIDSRKMLDQRLGGIAEVAEEEEDEPIQTQEDLTSSLANLTSESLDVEKSPLHQDKKKEVVVAPITND